MLFSGRSMKRKYQKNCGFLMFPGFIEIEYWPGIGQSYPVDK